MQGGGVRRGVRRGGGDAGGNLKILEFKSLMHLHPYTQWSVNISFSAGECHHVRHDINTVKNTFKSPCSIIT